MLTDAQKAQDTDPIPVEDPALETVQDACRHEQLAAAMQTLPERWRTVLWHAEMLCEPSSNIGPL